MKILLISLLILSVLAAKKSPTKVYTEEQLAKNKDFIACHNLGRIKSEEHFDTLSQLESDLGAEQYQAILRYMIDVIHNCVEKVPQDQKDYLFDSFLAGERLPDISAFSKDLFFDIPSTLKTLEDLQIPANQNGTSTRANQNGGLFRATFDKYATARKDSHDKSVKGLHIFGIDIDNVGNGVKYAYALGIIGSLCYFLYLASGVLFKEEDLNSKHQRPKKKGKGKKRKAKTS